MITSRVARVISLSTWPAGKRVQRGGTGRAPASTEPSEMWARVGSEGEVGRSAIAQHYSATSERVRGRKVLRGNHLRR